jgi:DNA-binding CsgD family transcriptional regulator
LDNRYKPLSRRAWDVCRLEAQGLGYKQVAHELGLTVGTVKQYRQRAARELGLKSSSDLIHTVYRRLRRDDQRVQAIKLDAWLRKWQDQMPEDAKAEMQKIIVECVVEAFPKVA